MKRWFLSYHSPDEALAEQIKAAIERKDPQSQVFFAPVNLRAGGAWTAQLAQEIADSDAFIFLVGEAGIGKWQVPEYDEALDRWVKSERTYPLIVVLLEGQNAPGLPFLRQLHWIVTPTPTSETDIGRLFDAAAGGGSRPSELWRYTSPYRGLEAMEEKDSDYFFGRKKETVEVLSTLSGEPDRLPVLIGNSGVGKSSLAQAGVLAALKRQAWPEGTRTANEWPAAFRDSRQWCYLMLKPGTDPIKALVDAFLDTWHFAATDPERVKTQHGWIEILTEGNATLADLIEATERRRKEHDQSKPPCFFLYIDQAEELYVRAEEHPRQRFSELLVKALPDSRLRAIMSMRSDFLGYLQKDGPLFDIRYHIDVPPLREAELREIVGRPAQLLAARFESEPLIDIITRRTAEDSIKDVGALPLLSYTLDDMWTQMVRRGDGTMRVAAQSFELGGVLVDRADKFLAAHPKAEAALRRVLTLRLATVREDGEPTRRQAARAEFTAEEWQIVCELADYPYRLLVTVTSKTGETFAEVAHEAIFRRWAKLRDWIAAEREFLAWRSSLEIARRSWESAPAISKLSALLMGFALQQAENWLAKRPDDLPKADCDFIARSINRERRSRYMRAFAYLGLVATIGGLIAWVNQGYIKQQWNWYLHQRPFLSANVQPYVLSATAEGALKPADSFRECSNPQGTDYCPEMVVVPAGSFVMGQTPGASPQAGGALPQHPVTIAQPFAVAMSEVTFDEWGACVTYGDCDVASRDGNWGRGSRPVIGITWDQAQQYAAWLSRITGKSYRLLSEAEYEYATRAGGTTFYPWGNSVQLNGQVMTNCNGCGSQWDGKQTAPVGSFPKNQFGLQDMLGNVTEWVADCYHGNYVGAPTDGSVWVGDANCGHLVRGGSYDSPAQYISSATRAILVGTESLGTSFRVARTLASH
jgi:formylglycine-generating enzyme required for sulfatase activity